MNILSRFEEVACRFPDHPAFIDKTGSCNFRHLQQQAQLCASYLSHVGISRGCRCIVSDENSTNTAITILAIWYCHAIPVLVNAQSTDTQINSAIAKTDAVMIASSGEHDPDAKTTILLSISANDLVIASRRSDAYTPIATRITTSASTIASIVFTSGSSGGPKGVAQTHQSLIAGCNSVYQCLDYQLNDTLLCPVPWSFDYGFGQLLTTLLTGITQIIPEGNSPFAICESIQKHQPTVFVGVPSLYAGLCQGLSPIGDISTSSIRLLTSTGSKLHLSTLSAIKDAFPNSAVSLNYGLTETYRSASLPVTSFDSHSNSVGFAIPGVDITVVRPDNSIAAPGETGEIVHRGCGIFCGYWADQERTDVVRKNDPLWELTDMAAPPAVFTGDLGWKDEDGYLYIKGRKDRQLKTMGVLVNPDEIENILLNQPQIIEAAVISKSDNFLGELIIAVYVLKQDSTISKKEIKRYCRDTMSPFMIPREFYQLEKLPRTSTQKTDYSSLKNLYSNNTRPID